MDIATSAYWDEHKGAFFYAANLCAEKYGGKPEDYYGVLYEKFSICSQHYDPDKGIRFGNYFLYGLWSFVERHLLRCDSDRGDVQFRRKGARRLDKKRAQSTEYLKGVYVLSFTSLRGFYNSKKVHGQDFDVEYPPHEDNSDVLESLLLEFGGVNDFWVWVSSVLPDRNVRVLRWRYISEKNFIWIGAKLGVSKQRAEQLLKWSLERLRVKLLGRDHFDSLFKVLKIRRSWSSS